MKKIAILLLTMATMAGTAAGQEAADGLKIISFNIRNSSAWSQDGENDWVHRREAVAAMILKEKPDALGMQEMLPDQLAYLDSALAEEYERIGVGRDDGDKAGENMCIYYRTERLELVKWETQWLSETRDKPSKGWDAACRRTVTVGRFKDKWSDKEFVYMNTHLDHVGKEARKSSILQLCEIMEAYDCPIVIGGDMNSDLDDEIFEPLLKQADAVRDKAPISDRAITYNAYGKGKASMIDHFFAKGFEMKSFRTLNGDYGVPYISDHYPIATIISLGGEQ